MSTTFIQGKPCTVLAHTRRAGVPFSNSDESTLIGVDYRDYTGGGAINARLTIQQATALRDALAVTLAHECEITIALDENGKLVTDCKALEDDAFNPKRPFMSVSEAVDYLRKQPRPWESMIAVCQANLEFDEVHFAKELAAAFVDSYIEDIQR